jgi:16S rRNA (cytosine967-C5)-methyltransferase
VKAPARLQAAIEIVEMIERDKGAMDRLLRNWGRANRYAGSKDRGAIRERVYGIVRNRGMLEWRSGETPRLWAAASLLHEDQLPISTVATFFTGEKHGPARLTDREIALLMSGTERADPPPYATGNYPSWLHNALIEEFAENLPLEMDALSARAPADVRVNTLKCSKHEAIRVLSSEGFQPVSTPLSPFGLRFPHETKLTDTKAYRDGLVEIQDAGSQWMGVLSGAKPGELVVELGAGAGGKSLLMAAIMKNEGRIIACDVSHKRLSDLGKRARRAGVTIIEERLVPGPGQAMTTAHSDLADVEGRADMVFIDAPCSGSGAWRRQPEARWRLTPAQLQELSAIQSSMLARALHVVRPGGRICYVTCSILRCENYSVVKEFLDDHPQMEMDRLWEIDQKGSEREESCGVQLTPYRDGTDGFFFAGLGHRDVT